jgi:hypothetical protein
MTQWWALETTIVDLLVFCRKRPDVAGRGRAAREHGANQHGGGDNVMSSRQGNDPTYTLGRLKRGHPELAEQVVAGEL